MVVQCALNRERILNFLQTRLWLGFQAHMGSVNVASSVKLSQFAHFTDEEAVYRN
jgi:hypothetical protein